MLCSVCVPLADYGTQLLQREGGVLNISFIWFTIMSHRKVCV